VEVIKKQLAAQPPEAGSAGGASSPGDTAVTQSGEAAPSQDAGRAGPAGVRRAAVRLDPAVLGMLRRCCGEECVSRLLACHE
jgi:hypothetical protein